MNRARNIGGFQPVNTLAGRKRDMPPIESHPTKKPFLDSQFAPAQGASSQYTTAQFATKHLSPSRESRDGSVIASQLEQSILSEKKARGTRRKGKGKGQWIHATGERHLISRKSITMDLTDDPICDDQDELSESRETKKHGVNKGLFKTGGDAADVHILGTQTKSKWPAKDSTLDIESEDELGPSSPARPTNKAVTTAPRNPGKSSAPSASSRGNIMPTTFHQPKLPGESRIADWALPVKVAYRQQTMEYIGPEDEADQASQLYLRPVGRSELRAFTTEDEPSADHTWLSITLSYTRSVTWTRDCCYVMVRSRIEPNAGQLMGLRLGSPEDVHDLVRWVETRLKNVEVQEEVRDPEKVPKSFRKIQEDVRMTKARAAAQPTSSPRLSTNPQKQIAVSLGNDGSSSTSSAKPERRVLLRDRMKKIEDESEIFEIPKETPTSARNLRSREKKGPILIRDPTPTPPPPRWSVQNTGWRDTWKVPLIFQRTTVDKDDIPRLDEGEFLNDNIIGFGIRFLFHLYSGIQPDLNKRVFVLNSFFHEKLKSNRSYKGQINYDGVKNWTAKVDLFSYDYIVVPVNEHAHWWVAIICNPGKIDPDTRRGLPNNSGQLGDNNVNREKESGRPHVDLVDNSSSDVEMVNGIEQFEGSFNTATAMEVDKPLVNSPSCLDEEGFSEIGADARSAKSKEAADSGRTRSGRDFGPTPKSFDPTELKIITLDSMGNAHAASVNLLKHYLVAEFEDKKKKTINLSQLPPRVGMKAVHIPEQSNFHDCGVYVLGYIHEFARNPDLFVQTLLRREKPKWTLDASVHRNAWRETIFSEHKKCQQAHLPAKNRGSSASVRTSKPSSSSPVKKTTPDRNTRTIEERQGSSSAKPSPVSADSRPLTAENKGGPTSGSNTPLMSTFGTPKSKSTEHVVLERQEQISPDGLDDEVSLLSVSKDHPVESVESQSDISNEPPRISHQMFRPIDDGPLKSRSKSRDVEEGRFIAQLSSPRRTAASTEQRAANGNFPDKNGRISFGDGDFSVARSTKFDNRPQPHAVSVYQRSGEGEHSPYFQPKSPASHTSPGSLKPTVPLVQAAEMITESEPRNTIDLTDD